MTKRNFCYNCGIFDELKSYKNEEFCKNCIANKKDEIDKFLVSLERDKEFCGVYGCDKKKVGSRTTMSGHEMRYCEKHKPEI